MKDSTVNKIKSYFISMLIAYNMVVMVAGSVMLYNGPYRRIWLGVTVAALMTVVFFARLYLVRVPRTSPGLSGFSIGVFLATIYAVYASYTLQIASAAPLLALITISGWMAYVGWYSDLGNRDNKLLEVGGKLPELHLEDYDHNPISSSDWKGQKRLVIFYRGNWCPICSAQINELTSFEKEFDELGVKVTLISPQSHEKSRAHAKRTGMNFDFLVDVGNRAAKVLGILHVASVPKGMEVLGYEPDAPKPTSFIVDDSGKIIYADLTTNYRIRPRPEDMLAALRQ